MSHFQKIGVDGAQLPADATDHVAVIDVRTNLMWSANDATDKTLPFKKCAAACKKLKLAGFTDWRMPTVEELFLLADRSKCDPAIDTNAFPSCTGGWYWTSTVDASAPSACAWDVNFYNGYAYFNFQVNQGRVRAVRSVSSPASGQ
jgi:hypothetical protein